MWSFYKIYGALILFGDNFCQKQLIAIVVLVVMGKTVLINCYYINVN